MTNNNPAKYSTFEPNVNYQGKTYFSGNVTNPEICQNLCLKQSNCTGWTFNNTNKECQLKNQITNRNNSIYMISGVINNNSPVTLDRFGNNTKNIKTQNTNPYYVTGIPIANETSNSVVSMDNSVPFDGRSNGSNSDQQRILSNENHMSAPKNPSMQIKNQVAPVPYNAPMFSQYSAPNFNQ